MKREKPRQMKPELVQANERRPLKLLAYSSLFAINQAFEEIIEHLRRLQDMKLITPEFAESQRVAVEESRAGINHTLTGRLNSTEQDDWAYFGRLRMTREKHEG